MKEIDLLVRRPNAWLASGQGFDIAVSSRVRLARNVDGRAFPGWADEKACAKVWGELGPLLGECESLKGALIFGMEQLDPVDKQVLTERHLISTELASKGVGSGLALRPDETMAVMVNEEDHLRMQAMRPGMDLTALWDVINGLDSEVERQVRYAFSPRLGYLTACPTNLGTGLRASVMLHLPGLRLTSEIDAIVRGLNKVGLAVRGLLGEGTEASGNMYQVSNQTTLGEREDVVIKRLTQIVQELIEHEQNARARLMEQRRMYLCDQVGRAFGVLSNASILPSREALDLLSFLRLGVELGLVKNASTSALNELILLTQPGHLQKIDGKVLGPEDRDIVRARVTREGIRSLVVGGPQPGAA